MSHLLRGARGFSGLLVHNVINDCIATQTGKTTNIPSQLIETKKERDAHDDACLNPRNTGEAETERSRFPC